MKLPITGFYYHINNEQLKIQDGVSKNIGIIPTKIPKIRPFQEVTIGQLKCFGSQDTNRLIPDNPKSLMGIF